MMGRLALVSALSGALILIIATLWAGWVYPDYDHISQFLSELGAQGSVVADNYNRFGLIPVGLFQCLLFFAAYRLLPRKTATTLALAGAVYFALGYVLSALFSCDFECNLDDMSRDALLHNVFALSSYLIGGIAFLALGFQSRQWPPIAGVKPYLLHLACGAGALALTSSLFSFNFSYVGLLQRLIEASIQIWLLAFGAYLYRLDTRQRSSKSQSKDI